MTKTLTLVGGLRRRDLGAGSTPVQLRPDGAVRCGGSALGISWQLVTGTVLVRVVTDHNRSYLEGLIWDTVRIYHVKYSTMAMFS